MNVDETYFALLQYDYTASGSDTVTAEIYDASARPEDPLEPVASQVFAGLDLDGSIGRFSVFTQDFGPAASVDEWRFGTELSDVIVPEPSTFILLVGLVAFAKFFKRK